MLGCWAYTWHSLSIHHLLQEMVTTTGCGPSPPNQVVVKWQQHQLPSSTLKAVLCPHSLFGWLCQVPEYTNRLHHLFPWPGVSLPVRKVSSDTVQLSNLESDCCDKSCEKPHWRPLSLGSRTTFKLRPLPLVLAWATSTSLTGHNLDSLTWLPSLIWNMPHGYRPLGSLLSLVTATEPALIFLFSYRGTAPLAHKDNALPVLLYSSAPSLPSLIEQPDLLSPRKVDFSASPHTQKGRSPCSFQTSLPEGQNKEILQVTLYTHESSFFFMCFTGVTNYVDKSHLTFALHKKQET